MSITDTAPEHLSERELFAEFIEISDRSSDSAGDYSKAHLRARRANLLAEIGERLETLEAIKALLSNAQSESEATTSHERKPDRG